MKLFTHLRLFLVVITLITFTAVQSQGITLPRTPSPAAEISQTIGISKVTVNYSRPSVNGRKIWGNLVPFGWNAQGFGNNKPAPWRAGANENTVITFSHDAKVEGRSVPAGSYGLFFAVNNEENAELILSKDHHSWGSFFYEPDRDQLRTNIKLRNYPMTEMLTYEFTNLSKNSGDLNLNWENKQFPVRIEFNVDSIVIANATDELKGVAGFTWQGYAAAANYATQNNVHPELAMQWADRAVTMNKNFNTLMAKQGLLKMSGKTVEAAVVRKEALAMGNETEINAYGYQLLNEKNYDEAIHIFSVNTERYPSSANAWDSPGEGYAMKGDKEKAIQSFRKSMTLNPTEATKANSVKYLKQLGAM